MWIRNAKKKLLKRDGPICTYCKKEFLPEELTVDHIIPVSKGGKDFIGNFVLACRKCNSRKGNRII